MLVIFCKQHGYIKIPSKTMLLQRFGTFITLYETKTDSPVASTEREPKTFRSQAWYGGVIYIILGTCSVQCVYQYHVSQVRKILR